MCDYVHSLEFAESTEIVAYQDKETVYSTYNGDFENDTVWSVYEALTLLWRDDYIWTERKE